MHYKKYIELTKANASKNIADDIGKTVEAVVAKHIITFDFNSHKTGLLLGNVQSGKTGHMLGILASAADNDFDVFFVMTSDSTHLQQQTLKRALQLLDTFCVCGELDDLRFLTNDMRKPIVLVLKKNTRVLETWKNNLISSNFLQGRGIFIIDDESDAASLNTKINKNDISTINQRISEIRKLANSSFYLQVTATPQSLFLQAEATDHRPEFVYYFQPGEGYLGGDFFYNTSEPYGEAKPPYPIRITAEEELKDLKEDETHIPEGMQNAITSFLITAAHLLNRQNKLSCNFLIHPSVSISDHGIIAGKIGEALNNLLLGVRDEDSFKDSLKEAWLDLQVTKPDILDFDECYDFISKSLENQKINVYIMNSKTSYKADFDEGMNIIVGGNSLGRGVTFPNLNTTYYCRRTKKPQADTSWQHCRAFGYDREAGLARVFLPATLFKLFADLNNANNAMIEYIQEKGVEGIKLIYPKNVNPTRTNVIDKSKLEIIVGGANHFPCFPTNKDLSKLDALLKNFGGKDFYEIKIDLLKEVITLCHSEYMSGDWPSKAYINCIDSLQSKNLGTAILIVRRGRRISKGTGTLLSPDDRKLGDKFNDKVVFTVYRIDEGKAKGWDFESLWIPNIKLPKGNFFYSVN